MQMRCVKIGQPHHNPLGVGVGVATITLQVKVCKFVKVSTASIYCGVAEKNQHKKTGVMANHPAWQLGMWMFRSGGAYFSLVLAPLFRDPGGSILVISQRVGNRSTPSSRSSGGRIQGRKHMSACGFTSGQWVSVSN